SGVALFRDDGGGPSGGNVVVNNTIINAANARFDLTVSDGSTNNTIFNNILYNLNASISRGSISLTTDALAGFKSDYNFLDPRFAIDDVSGKTLAQWRTATGSDTHSAALSPAKMQALFKDYANDKLSLASKIAARAACFPAHCI